MRGIQIQKRIFLTLLAVIPVILTGCEDTAGQSEPPSVVTYMVIAPEKEALVLKTELPGRTSAYNISEVRPQISGIIQERLFDQGDPVQKGQPLYQIDPALYEASAASAEAALKRAEANAQSARLLAARYGEIVRTKAVSKQEYDNAVAGYAQAEADIAAAKAALQTARINLGYTKIDAPISGYIGRSSVTSGALVTQNQAAALAVIQQLNPIYVDVTQSGKELLRLRRAYNEGSLQSSGNNAAKVTLLLPDGAPYMGPDKDGAPALVEGDLLFAEVSVDPSTGSVTLRAEFPNPDRVLLPGMFVRAVVEEGAKKDAILIPQKTVQRNNRGDAVVNKLAPVEGLPDMYTVTQTVVTLGRDVGGDKWLVLEGLNAGDKIMVDGLMKLRRGKPVPGKPHDFTPKNTENGNGAPVAPGGDASGTKE